MQALMFGLDWIFKLFCVCVCFVVLFLSFASLFLVLNYYCSLYQHAASLLFISVLLQVFPGVCVAQDRGG